MLMRMRNWTNNGSPEHEHEHNFLSAITLTMQTQNEPDFDCNIPLFISKRLLPCTIHMNIHPQTYTHQLTTVFYKL